MHRYDEALAAYDRSLELKPGSADTHFARGFTLHKLGRSDEAFSAYSRCLDLRPTYLSAVNNRALILMDRGRPGEALVAFDQVSRLAPDTTNTLANRGAAQVAMGRFKEALRTLDDSLKVRPDDPETLSNRGVALEGLGRSRQAIRGYQKAIREAEKKGMPSAKSWARKGAAQYRRRWLHPFRVRRSAGSFQRALDIDDTATGAHNGLGVCMVVRGLGWAGSTTCQLSLRWRERWCCHRFVRFVHRE
jgi:tetratricopeptide (TPR) repeat protein